MATKSGGKSVKTKGQKAGKAPAGDVDLRRLLFIMILAGGVVLFLASVGGSFIIRQALQPVNSVAEVLHQDLEDRVAEKLHA